MCLLIISRAKYIYEMQNYLPIVALLILGVLFAGVSFLASRLLSPNRVTKAKVAPYECGIVPNREPPERFPVGFYLVAMIFIIFDIEVIFIFPWALVFGQLKVFGLVEVLAFAVVVLFSFMYILANGALNWGPPKRIVKQPSNQERTSTSTVQKVNISVTKAGEAA
jgi:NADH-quinone oxidoreductase subunit A